MGVSIFKWGIKAGQYNLCPIKLYEDSLIELAVFSEKFTLYLMKIYSYNFMDKNKMTLFGEKYVKLAEIYLSYFLYVEECY